MEEQEQKHCYRISDWVPAQGRGKKLVSRDRMLSTFLGFSRSSKS